MISAYDKFIFEAIKNRPKSADSFLALKKEISGKIKLPLPTNADLRETYEKLVKQGQIKRDLKLEEVMLSRRIRTQSGVAVVAVLTKPYPCPGKCLYCPGEKNMPKSYLSNEPAVMRAIASKFNPYLQVWNRLRSLELNGHQTDKIELIVMGGTFSFLPKNYQRWFIFQCFKACNNYPAKIKNQESKIKMKDLLSEQKRNEMASRRVVGLTLETRPDYIDEKEIQNFRSLGCTRVELGVQSVFDDVLKLNQRGHDVAQTIKATKLLKDAGFKINYHIMPGLPGSSLKKDYQMFKELFSNPDFQPDMLKIYPTVVLKNSALYSLWKKQRNSYKQFTAAAKNGLSEKYAPLTDKKFFDFILEVKNKIIPPYVRISRLVRDVPSVSIIAGPKISNLRQLIAQKSHCPCIRCREVGTSYETNEKMILDRIDYEASGGREIFLQYASPDKKKLFALLRLRIPSTCHPEQSGVKSKNLARSLGCARDDKLYDVFPVLKRGALIREVHTYGKLTAIDKKDKKSPQHIGLGKKLMREAERIAKEEYGLKKMAVIAGVGVREYYRKLGYKLKKTYMIKKI